MQFAPSFGLSLGSIGRQKYHLVGLLHPILIGLSLGISISYFYKAGNDPSLEGTTVASLLPSPLQPPVRMALVGTGFAAQRRAEALHADARARLVAVAGHTPDNTRELAQAYGARVAESWQAAVADAEVDAIGIATVNRDHAPIARAALEAGKHVVVEYPPALDPDQAQGLVALARQRQLLLHVEHIELLGGVHQAVRRYLPEVGTPVYARYLTLVAQQRTSRPWSYSHTLFGFPLSGALSRFHRLIDLFGTVRAVSCQARYWPSADPDFYDACFCHAQLRFGSELIAEVGYGKGNAIASNCRTLELHGTQGTLVFEGSEGALIRNGDRMPIEVESRRGLFARDTTAFLDALVGQQPLYLSPERSCYALQVSDAARRSAETGQTVAL